MLKVLKRGSFRGGKGTVKTRVEANRTKRRDTKRERSRDIYIILKSVAPLFA
jgi:hypothetical protein